MGHQVNFFVMPADLPELEAAIRSTGEVCFLAGKSPTAQPVELGGIALEQAAGPLRFQYYIVQRQELSVVSTRFSEPQGCWLIEDTRSPVIEFAPSRFIGSGLSRGRAYFASDLRFRPELPGPDFVRWGDKVLSRLKRKLTRRPELAPGLYFGASALEWIHDSGAVMSGGAVSFTTSGGLSAR